MKVLILGGVAAGTKVAAKLLRENRGPRLHNIFPRLLFVLKDMFLHTLLMNQNRCKPSVSRPVQRKKIKII